MERGTDLEKYPDGDGIAAVERNDQVRTGEEAGWSQHSFNYRAPRKDEKEWRSQLRGKLWSQPKSTSLSGFSSRWVKDKKESYFVALYDLVAIDPALTWEPIV